jgi:hypothetical protein
VCQAPKFLKNFSKLPRYIHQKNRREKLIDSTEGFCLIRYKVFEIKVYAEQISFFSLNISELIW